MSVIFFLLWVVFNGKITTEIIVFGIIIATIMEVFICEFMGYQTKSLVQTLKTIGFAVVYFIILIWEVIKANIQVVKVVLSPKLEIQPQLVRYKTSLKSDTAKVLLGNSITLTPGTITISLEKDEYLIHCLDQNMAEGIEDSIFVKLLKKMEAK